jgi:hypothetical protein
LAAEYVVDIPDGRLKDQIMREYLQGDIWWRKVISHYIGLSGNISELKNWLSTQIDQLSFAEQKRAKDQGSVLLREIMWMFPDMK